MVFLNLVLECEDVDCVQSSTDGLEVVHNMSWSDLHKQGFLVLHIEDPRFFDRVKDQHVCLELRLGVELVSVHARLPCDLFFSNNGRLVVVCDGRVVYGRSCVAMKSEVPSVSRLVFAC